MENKNLDLLEKIVIESIAKCTRATRSHVEEVYLTTKSFDKTIQIIKLESLGLPAYSELLSFMISSVDKSKVLTINTSTIK